MQALEKFVRDKMEDGIKYQKLIKFFEILALNQFVYKFAVGAVGGRRGRWGPSKVRRGPSGP
jgi:hypothetical protein